MPIVDAHLDLAWNVTRGRDVTRPAVEQPIIENETATTGLPDLYDAGVVLTCATIFCQPKTDAHAGYVDQSGAAAQAREQLATYNRLVGTRHISVIDDAASLGDAALNAILLMEGADAMTLDAESADASPRAWWSAGVRMVGLAWGRTRWAGGTGALGPLTDDGRRLVGELDEVGFIHDASHLAEASFLDLLDLTRRPICATHSNCRALVRDDPRGRHLSDEMIRALLARDGLIGINLFDRFLLPPDVLKTRRATLADVVAHVKHVCDLAGDAKHVGLGTDLDGGFGREMIPEELHTAADLPKLADALSTSGFDDRAVAAIMSENWLRFFGQSLPS